MGTRIDPTNGPRLPQPLAIFSATERLPLRVRALIAAGLFAMLAACGGGEPEQAVGSENGVGGGVNSALEEPVPPSSGDATVGVMGPKGNWPLVPIHMGLMPDGRMMSFGRESSQAAEMLYDVWDYREGLGPGSHLTLPNRSGTDLFCANQLLLSTGELLMTGGDTRVDGTANTLGYQTGQGNADATVFNPDTNQITRRGTMNEPRWYGSMTKLPTGEVFIQGGSTKNAAQRAQYTEIASEDGRQYRSLRGFDVYDLPWFYPRNFVDRSGQIVGWAKRHAYRLDPTGQGGRTNFGLAPQVILEDGGLAVMYRPGKVLLAGGRSPRAVRVDINGALPVYESVPDMSSPRIWGTATVLPSGDVLATNGGDNDSSAANAELGNPAFHVSIYNPQSNTWQRGPSSGFARLYHSASILLPDATVLLGGGGLPGPVTNLNAEIYYPAYLFNPNGSYALRPEIVAAPTVLNPGSAFSFTVNSGDELARVVLVKTGAVTHSFDMDQRFIELPLVVASDEVATRLPENAADTTPGFYHLFVLNRAGVPSVSKILRINPFTGALPPPPAIGPATLSAGDKTTINSAGFELACAATEVLVGIHGDVQDSLLAAGPWCAQVDSTSGQWSGEPVRRPAAGRMTRIGNPDALSSVCPSGQAVSGFQASADQVIRQIVPLCRRLLNASELEGPSSAAVSLGLGPAAPAISCADNRPAIGIRGSTDLQSDQLIRFGLRCAAGFTPLVRQSAN